MISITETQHEALSRPSRAAAVARLSVYMRRHFEARLAGVDDAQLDALVSTEWRRAEAAGVVSERDLKLFLALRVAVGERWRDAPWARAILDDAEAAKPDRLIAAARPHVGPARG